MKNSIEILKNKISRNKQGNDNRVFGKIKGLKHFVMQLENEIQSLEKQIVEMNKQEKELQQQSKDKDTTQAKDIAQLEHVYSEYEARLKEVKLELKNANQELNLVIAKTKNWSINNLPNKKKSKI